MVLVLFLSLPISTFYPVLLVYVQVMSPLLLKSHYSFFFFLFFPLDLERRGLSHCSAPLAPIFLP